MASGDCDTCISPIHPLSSIAHLLAARVWVAYRTPPCCTCLGCPFVFDPLSPFPPSMDLIAPFKHSGHLQGSDGSMAAPAVVAAPPAGAAAMAGLDPALLQLLMTKPGQ